MANFMQVFGCVVIVLILIVAVIGGVLLVLEAWERRATRIRGHAQARAIRDIGAELTLGAHWYYEGGKDAPALLVKCIGEHMMKYGTYTEQQVRDEWRRLRKGAGE